MEAACHGAVQAFSKAWLLAVFGSSSGLPHDWHRPYAGAWLDMQALFRGTVGHSPGRVQKDLGREVR